MPSATPVVGETPTMTNGSRNGVNGHASRIPSLSGLSLTEYSANPTPSSDTPSSRLTDIIPPEFILPNGHPDVGLSSSFVLIDHDS
jgi:threonine dehydratase